MIIDVLKKTNDLIAAVCLQISWVLVALMTAIILLQVFFRYVLNSALPWPEEAARGLMIWMTALVAAPAYRKGNFAAINLLGEYLPERAAAFLRIFIQLASLLVLFYLFQLSLNFFQRGFRTRAASFELKLAWFYLSMPVCFGAMILANLEMTFDSMRSLFRADARQ